MIQNENGELMDTRFTEKDETKQIYRVAGYAFFLNLFLAVIKTILAFFSGSLAITASAIDSGTDAAASLVILGGVKLSVKKTRSFPLGLYKLENIASIVIALFIFIAGYEIIREIFSSREGSPHITLPYIILLLAGTVVVFLFGQYAMSIGRRTESPILIAEGRHRHVDVLSSIVVLLSVIISYFDLHLNMMGITVDQLGAALILIFIARAGWGLLSDGMRVLLDASVDFSTLDRIREIIKGEPLVSKIESLMGRSAGRFRFIQATIRLKTENLERAHQISEKLEMKIRKEVQHIEKIVIHYEPEKKTFYRIAFPLEDTDGRISMHFGEAPYFGIVHIRRHNNKIEKQEILENPHRSVEIAKGIRVAEWLIMHGVEHVAIKENVSRKGGGYALSSAGVQIHLISAGQIEQAISEVAAEGL
jgi:cation diffusion facilitator family transporter